jgi:FkbM family methyltransferase
LDSISVSYWEPNLIKIDVEGTELNVLNGSKRIIKKVNPAIIFEFDPNNESVKTFMSKNNY